MNNKHHNPNSNTPRQQPDEPRGDRGKADKTWSPQQGEQGISNRVGDEGAERPTPKGTDTAATTDADVAEREKGKRTTM